jgi:glutamate transport system ATP-binding protein
MSFIRDVANRVVMMAEGRIIEEGVPQAFFRSPESDRARAFVSRVRWHLEG